MAMEVYIKLLLIVIFSLLIPIGMILIQKILSPKPTQNENKYLPYESGEVPITDAWLRYPVRFYIVAFLFLIFDIEVAFILPFTVVFKKLGLFAVIEAFVFIFILLIGWIYLYRKKAYRWE